jgi:RNA polymerase sigma-70 factor (ECF subfamily)
MELNMRSATALDFETVVELYYQPVFTFAVKLCGKVDRALKLTQHTFCLALNRENYLGKTKLAKSWLLTLLFREFLKEERLEREARSWRATYEHPSNARTSSPVFAALTKVREEFRIPLVLYYAKDWSLSQVGDHMGISMETVLTRLSKGREELGRALAPSVGRRRLPLVSSSEMIRPPDLLPLAA